MEENKRRITYEEPQETPNDNAKSDNQESKSGTTRNKFVGKLDSEDKDLKKEFPSPKTLKRYSIEEKEVEEEEGEEEEEVGVGEEEEVGDEEKAWEYEWEENSETQLKENLEENESSSSSETLSSIYTKLSPFNIKWSFGVKRSIELINLTTANTFEVFYVSSHFGVIYNYKMKTMTFLPGHNYCITSISSDASGRWLVTADGGEDSVIIIWDNKRRLPAWCLYNVFPDEGTKIVKISQDARFLTAINMNFIFTLKLWMWTYGRHKPDGVLTFDPAYGKGKHIDFNHLDTEQFAVTMEYKVIFCQWVNESKQIKSFVPNIWFNKKLGIFRESVFLDDNHTVFTCTSMGQILVWSDVKYSETITEQIPSSIEKNLLKVIKIHKSGITSLRLCDKAVVTGSEDGTILYHDQQLRLIYMTPSKTKLDPLVSISFNLVSATESEMDPFSPDFTDFDEKVQSVFEYESTKSRMRIRQKSRADFEKERKYAETESTYSILHTGYSRKSIAHVLRHNPSDYTLDSKTFIMRDFIFLTTTGKIGYVSHRRKKIKNYLYEAEADISAIECNPNKNHVVVGNTAGHLVFYDYMKKKLLIAKEMANEPITALKYSSMGQILMIGFQSGVLMEVEPITLVINSKLDYAKAPIKKICFSQTDGLMAFYDQASIVYLLAKQRSTLQWNFMGKHMSHYKPIVDIIFERNSQEKTPRLFTIGEDRMLVEYDTSKLEPGKLKLRRIVRIEQTAIPFCFDWHPKFHEGQEFIISNNEYKLKVVDMATCTCQKTTLGPTADTPINFIKVVHVSNEEKEGQKMIYTTKRHIGIRMLPSTGNPFEGMGMMGHPEKIVSIGISYDYNYIFTAGENDASVLMWSINFESLQVASSLGGTGLQPFVSLIENGPDGFLFKEIEDFFYYAQIIHQGEDPNASKTVTKSLALCEIPDLFRSLGYYPTDYEVNNLLHELKHLNYHKTGKLLTEITFEECVKVFLNHRPVVGVSLDHINKALMAIADLSDPTDIIVEREELYKALEEKAEPMDRAEMIGYLCILLLPKDENNPVPPTLTLKEFAENVLGIDLTISEEAVRKITHGFENKNSD